ncbi:hypothetical protein HJC23_011914 [Cyclotella cryptica]|uniref:EF-hand domain-containing protein n=1 Tax=Cyclotella cryptica TaxID=29204 RepID=A0ABD3NLN0_9STRA|eukprot:CCRYP_020475-RA/>CCRYP_020475-RA protein AED:0.10 eAED:0.10 QI:0/-1/0/1/-1/1/1/0/240
MKSPISTPTKITPLASRLREPIQSPFPPPSTTTAATTTTSPLHEKHSQHGLSARHIAEITTVFRLFDPDLSGYIDPPSLEVMARSLGFRMSPIEVLSEIELAWEERMESLLLDGGEQPPSEDATAEERRRIDLDMTLRILAKKGYSSRNTQDEMEMYFRLFDGGEKGYITLHDLKRVQNEIRQSEMEIRKEMQSELDVFQNTNIVVCESTLEAMMEEFDLNQDGVIDREEFRRIVEPILS